MIRARENMRREVAAQTRGFVSALFHDVHISDKFCGTKYLMCGVEMIGVKRRRKELVFHFLRAFFNLNFENF